MTSVPIVSYSSVGQVHERPTLIRSHNTSFKNDVRIESSRYTGTLAINQHTTNDKQLNVIKPRAPVEVV
jgi:hypothetical protein